MTIIKEELDATNRKLGSGWLSGTLSVFLAAIGLGAVLCMCYPQLLTAADARELYHMGLIRLLVHLVLIAAFLLGLQNRRMTNRLVDVLLDFSFYLILVLDRQIDRTDLPLAVLVDKRVSE